MADTYLNMFDTYFSVYFVNTENVKPNRINELNKLSLKARESYKEITETLMKSKDSIEPNVIFKSISNLKEVE